MAPIVAALGAPYEAFRQVVVHTGPALRQRLSDDVLADLGVPGATTSSASAPGAHGEQTAQVLAALREVLLESARSPSWWPATSTRRSPARWPRRSSASRSRTSSRACARVTGACPRRSTASSPTGSRTSCFTHSPEGDREPRRRGDRRRPRVRRRQHDDRLAAPLRAPRARAARVGTSASRGPSYVLVTLHRPSNVDEPERLRQIAAALIDARARDARSCSRSTRAPARASRPPASSSRLERGRRALHRAAGLPRLPLARRPAPARSSPTPAASRRRRPRSASPASRSGRTPSARSR